MPKPTLHVGELTPQGLDKVERYKWRIRDEPGRFMAIDKLQLRSDDRYQRHSTAQKVLRISGNWSWMACGCILVAERNGSYWVVDGAHRVAAARQRSDITSLPCLVFQTEDVREEAHGFVWSNTERKPMTIFAKYKALLCAGDPTALAVERVSKEINVELVQASFKSRQMKSVEWALREIADEQAYRIVVGLAATVQTDSPVHRNLLEGFMYLHRRLPSPGLNDARLIKRLRQIGGARLLDATRRAAAFYARGGAKVYASGILEEVNKGLRNKYELEE